MAVKASNRSDLKTGLPAAIIGWTTLANGDTGDPVEMVDYPDKTVTITGTFGVGGSITLQGSNNNSDWFALTDPQGNAITKTAAAMELVLECPRYIRPNVTAGDGTTALVVQILCRRTAR